MVNSTEDRIEIVETHYHNEECAKAATIIFNSNHPERNVSHQYTKFIQLTIKLKISGSIHNNKHQVFRPVRNESVEFAVLGHAQMDNQPSSSDFESPQIPCFHNKASSIIERR